MNTANIIKELRQQTGMNRREFSEYTKIPVRTLEDWEAGKRTPPEYIVVLQIIYSFMLHFIYNHFQDYPKCHITLFKPDYAHKILLSKNEAHYLTRMRLLTARTFGFSVTYD